MCTYLTEKLDVEGSGKGAAGWFALCGVPAGSPLLVRAIFGGNVRHATSGAAPIAREILASALSR